jgi:lysophospholipase L1-like esterase
MTRTARLFLLLLLIGLIGLPLAQARAQSTRQAPAFEKDQRICFLGDSIFHGGKVHSDLLLFYATRFPEAPLQIFNLGVAGDTAKGALRRLDWELKPHTPHLTVIMFGMNDVGRWLYGPGKDSPAILAQRKRLMQEHVQSMDQLTRAVEAMGSRLILCTPTPYDQTTQRKTANALGVDTALSAVADNVRWLARDKGYGLVDFHKEMNRILHEQQAKNPAFTMMDAARVHPNDAGQLLMMYLFLQAQAISPTVSTAALDAAAGTLAESARCRIVKIQRQPDVGLAFDYEAEALTFPLADEVKVVRDWVPFDQDLNQERLTITHLPPGRYELRIDEQSVGTWSADELAGGINLAANDKTPQYQQAVAVMHLNEKRRHLEESTLRIFAALEHDVLRPQGVDPSDLAAVRTAMDKAIAEEGRNKTWRFSYFTNLSKVYYAQKPHQKQIEAQLADMTRQLFTTAHPHPHHYDLRPVK